MAVTEVIDSGHVRTIRLNRPDKKNALNSELAWGIVTDVEEAARVDDVWVVAITGAGDAFCSGLDLEPSEENAPPLSPQDGYLDDTGWVGRFALVLRQLCDKPIVGGINGVAVGAGLSLAMACDIRLAARSARLMPGYPRLAASPDGGLTFTLPQAIGYEQAMRMLMENRTVGADEALELGLVGEVVDDNHFEGRLTEYCALLAERSPIGARLTKRGIVRSTTAIDLEMHVRYEIANIMRAFASKDSEEARQAFFERRPPQFEGH